MKIMKIEIELKEFSGYEYTGEYRFPIDNDEWGHDPNHSSDQLRALTPKRKLFILRKIEPIITLSARIILSYPDYTCRMFDFYEVYKGDRKVLCLKDTNRSYLLAGSMQGCFKYVYECSIAGIDGFFIAHSATKTHNGKTIHPVGALFYKVEK